MLDKRYDQLYSVLDEKEDKHLLLSLLQTELSKATQFKIHFFHKGKDDVVIRKGFFDEMCRVWETQKGKIAVCFVCLDNNDQIKGYRTATDIEHIEAMIPTTMEVIN
tara:strand:+ start:198 stop:518 length:321 start_codon:yes stop_codon:yes gene_type:complete